MMLLYCLATTSTAPFLNISQVYQVNQFGTSTDGPNNIIARACKCNAMQCKVYAHVVSTTAYTIYKYIQRLRFIIYLYHIQSYI